MALTGVGRAAEVFRAIAHTLSTEVAAPVEAVDMAGCSARMLEAVAAALDGVPGNAQASES